ncbi:co-chaperone GrpE protein [Cardiosporidium cionae]|uniref:GrpE protein homolog n=1 Tax=Cardiosporidium cionae TaxID=476202 RepID=A0ABQ7JDH0_9APIC|nr:co-chaperone GrpE protein [Cardiosporidium cionae]|eukprot:KAF8822072.1 co-chaperone GrpE protein [Cardiosporidium cionae]
MANIAVSLRRCLSSSSAVRWSQKSATAFLSPPSSSARMISSCLIPSSSRSPLLVQDKTTKRACNFSNVASLLCLQAQNFHAVATPKDPSAPQTATGTTLAAEGEDSTEASEASTSASAKEEVKQEASVLQGFNELKEEAKKLREEHSVAVEKAKELQGKLLRCYADLENSRKRHEKEIASSRQYAISNFAKSILSIADNLALATASIDPIAVENNMELKQIYEGVKLTESVFHSALDKFGIVKYEPLGEKFDPVLHEALFEMADPTKTKGDIAKVVQSGYKIQDRLLRAAKVGVVKN